MVDVYTDIGVGAEGTESQKNEPLRNPLQAEQEVRSQFTEKQDSVQNLDEQILPQPQTEKIETSSFQAPQVPHDFSQALKGYKKSFFHGSNLVLKIGVSLMAVSIIAAVLYLVFG